jgi:tRNA(fMet)-specific endonuclease VapC
MLILDTDHLVEIDRGSTLGSALLERLVRSGEDVVTTIISAEEQLRGWLAQINRQTDVHRQIDSYCRLKRRLDFFADWHLLPWDTEAAERFETLRAGRIRIGTMDLKIASIALVRDGTLLSRNLADFGKVPGLNVEDWLSTS